MPLQGGGRIYFFKVFREEIPETLTDAKLCRTWWGKEPSVSGGTGLLPRAAKDQKRTLFFWPGPLWTPVSPTHPCFSPLPSPCTPGPYPPEKGG